jgi:hypothetical protein
MKNSKTTSKLINWLMRPHFRFSLFATLVSVIGLILLIISARNESTRHREETLAEEGKRKNIDEDDIQFVKRMNRESFEINEVNTYGTIFVFLGFFLQQGYNMVYRM